MEQHLLFFLGEFHNGAMNHVIHFIGFTVLGYGLGVRSWKLVVISPFIMELGHMWNYFQGMHSDHALRIIPLQLLAWLVFVAAGYGFARLYKKSK